MTARAAFAAVCLTLPARADAQAGGPHPYRPGLDVVDYAITLDLPDRGPLIDGRAVLAIRRTAPGDTLVLDLVALRVDSVLVNDQAVKFARTDSVIRIPTAQVVGDSFSVTVRYSGEPKDGLIIRTDSLGRWTGFGDNWPNRARNWIPSIDHPSDKATVTWVVRAPSDRKVVANGELMEETPLPSRAGGAPRTLTRWRESRPIPPYLMVIAAAPLVYYALGREGCGVGDFDGCVKQSVYVAPELRDYLPGPFAHAAPIVKLFSQLVAPFPYEKLAHLQSSTRYGGMENAGAIFYSDAAFRRRALRPELIAHETAHQWFGDAVTEREWSHAWLSEGFATYFAELYVEHSEGDSAFRANLRRIREQVIKAPEVASRPVIDTTQTNLMELLNTNSYQKGGWTLHMLRALVGDSAFFRGIRSYYLANRHSTAYSDDLRRAVEGTSGRSLGWFFDQWLRRPGFAELTTSWRYDAAQRRVVATIAQGTRFGAYRFPLTVAITDASGRERRATIDVPASASSTISVPLDVDAAPRTVTFDPDVRVLATFTAR
ncbi:MAG TPA: M1 family metallopeptidase [Gemmatimonadaceae bacterium]|nr:M1 family metallopeptidase [Gemmatimonadaceae bacterium]